MAKKKRKEREKKNKVCTNDFYSMLKKFIYKEAKKKEKN